MSLTKQQAKLLAFIKQSLHDRAGVCPSFQEMADGIGIKSKSGIHPMMKALEERGYISRPAQVKWRCITVHDRDGLGAYSIAELKAELAYRQSGKRIAA